MNCILYGEQMEKVRKKKTRDLVTSLKTWEKEQCKFSFRGIKKHETNTGNPFSAFKIDKKEMAFDEPICLGFINLKISKLHMNQIYYDVLKFLVVKSSLVCFTLSRHWFFHV